MHMLTGKTLRAARNLRGISQAELAERAQCSPVSISRYESEKADIMASTLVKLCIALNVSVTYRIDGTEISGP